MTPLHEPASVIGEAVVDRHRAVASLIEELEAVDWYDQRVAATSDRELAAVLTHSRDEEKEHAAMTLEWLRRRDPQLDLQLRKWLFTERPLERAAEEEAEGADRSAGSDARLGPTTSLGIGGLRDGEG